MRGTPHRLGVRINTSCSCGRDDEEFVDLVGRLRYTEVSLYTQRDTPMFTCFKMEFGGILCQLA